MPERDSETGRFVAAEKAPTRQTGTVAASFDHIGSLARPIWFNPHGGVTMVDQQKFRNNWLRLDLRAQISACRRVSDQNGLVRPILEPRHASYSAGFRLADDRRAGEKYDFSGLVDDILHEDLISNNVVALWRKGQSNPPISILDAEQVDYSSVGGIEKIRVRCPLNKAMAADLELKEEYIRNLGEKMYKAYCTGGHVTIASGYDEDWDFRVMSSGKRRGCFRTPDMVGLLDTIDFLELMKVGDWNVAWFRKDVIRLIRKGYKGTGQGSLVNAVDMSDDDKTNLGEGFSKLAGNANVPANHDVDPSYLLMPSDALEAKQVESAIDRLLMWGGIEAVILLGSFSQQNGAAPSLMRNHRTIALAKRAKVEQFLRSIFTAPEFKGLVKKPAGMRFEWSVKSLYSVDEIAKLVTSTADGIASPQTRRGWLDLNDEVESRLMAEAHKNKENYTPPFEARQGLLNPDASPTGPENDPGRPPESET